MADQVPIAEGLFTWPDESPALIGGQCSACGWVSFPMKPGCARCGAEHVEARQLPREGILWSWTIQGFRPKTPPYTPPESALTDHGEEKFEPFGVGYIQLAKDIIVEAHLTESDPERLQIGMAMELIVFPYRRNEQGNWLMSYAFQPQAGSQGEGAQWM
ncbi:MAG: OB-fold domain-containing protein [Pseudomonadales bacterium]|nr:OB-fold domain-containing protein [Pseudomonadales bacterium]